MLLMFYRLQPFKISAVIHQIR